MSDDRIEIIAVGMMTPIGLSAPETAASVRSATMRFTETSWLDRVFEPFVMGQVIDDGLPPLSDELEDETGISPREIRMLQLAARPLAECLAPLDELNERIPLVLALPEHQAGRAVNPEHFLRWLAIQAGDAFDGEASEADWVGRAGGLCAVGRAVERLREGDEDFVVAGGVDTFRSLQLMATLDVAGRIKTAQNLDGFVPAEGAGFVLLAKPDAARRINLPALAAIAAFATGFEEGHFRSDEPYQGNGLAETLAEAVKDADPPVREVFSSMNGESYWGKEWGVGFMRSQDKFDENHVMNHPADCYGDVGAASGPLMLGLASLGMAQAYRQSPALVLGSSDFGDRAAILLTNA